MPGTSGLGTCVALALLFYRGYPIRTKHNKIRGDNEVRETERRPVEKWAACYTDAQSYLILFIMSEADELAAKLARRNKILDGEEVAPAKAVTVFNPYTEFPVRSMHWSIFGLGIVLTQSGILSQGNQGIRKEVQGGI